MFKPLLGLSIAALFSVGAQAAPVTYKVEPSHTYVQARYQHLGFSTQSIRFDDVHGTITLDLEAKTGAIDMTVGSSSLSSGFATFDGHLNGKDHLDTVTFPKATFTSTDVKFEGDTPVSAQGELTIKGISQAVTLDITHFKAQPHPMLRKDAIGADGIIRIKRSEFNAGKNAPAVSDETEIVIAIEAIAQ